MFEMLLLTCAVREKISEILLYSKLESKIVMSNINIVGILMSGSYLIILQMVDFCIQIPLGMQFYQS